MEQMKKALAMDFVIKDLGHLKYFLCMEAARSKKGNCSFTKKTYPRFATRD